jgi:CheY-like chemotaxis protein/HPt (histidine-containing phosphotransfer) domain-containing protein
MQIESSPQRFLVVDDEEDIRTVVHDFLDQLGHSCDDAGSASEALAMLATQHYDLVISDIKMEGKNGIEFMLQAQSSFSNVDFIIMTGHAAEYSYSDIIRAGASDYLAKPFNMKELQAKLERIQKEKTILHELQETNKKLDEALENASQMAEGAKAASRAKSQFLANISHEIRTPLNGLTGMIGLLLDTELNHEQRDYAQTASTASEALMLVINDVLDYSKLEVGKVELETIDFDLRLVVEDVMDVLAYKGHQKKLEIACLIDHEVPSPLLGDPGRLRQILMNLVGNAIKFTQEGEVVLRITVDREQDTQAKITFAVTDTGVGIPEDRMDRLFKSFSQVDSSTTRKYGGSGLGLTISQQLVELMGGQIGVESKTGKGSRFWFSIVFEKQPEGQGREIVVPGDISGKRILVVDDNETNRHVLREQLKAWDCRFDEAHNGKAALKRLREARADTDPFDIAIIDMQMPQMDGETLGRKIKEDSDLMDTILVMLTSAGRRGDAARLKEIGFAGYLPKPVRHVQLFECLAAVTGMRKQASKAQPATLVTQHSIAEDRKRRIRILVAEDDATNQKLVRYMLERFGYRADIVSNGQEAINALETVLYDIVLMDVQMPEMDGFEAAAHIRDPDSAVPNHNVPIVALTAHAMKGYRERCIEAGMDEYVSKPIQPNQLLTAIERQVFGKAPPKASVEAEVESPKEEVFDRAGLIERLDGRAELCDSLIGVFVENVSQRIVELEQALTDGDEEQVALQGHAIKGASANMEAQVIRKVAYEIETAAKAGKLKKAGALAGTLEGELERFKGVSSRLCNS